MKDGEHFKALLGFIKLLNEISNKGKVISDKMLTSIINCVNNLNHV